MFSGAHAARTGRASPVFLSYIPAFTLAGLLLMSVGAVPAVDRVAARDSATGERGALNDGVYRPLESRQETNDRNRSRWAGLYLDLGGPYTYDGPGGPVQRLLNEGKYSEALRLVRDRLKSDLTPYQRALLLRFAAQLEVELDNYQQAIRDIEASFETGVLTDAEKAENYYFLGRLYLGVEPPNYPKSIENLREFIGAAENPDPDAFFYLGQALALTGKCKEAIPQAEKAIELSKMPKEEHHRLLLFCYSGMEDYARLVPLVERMLTMFSVKDEYLAQLADGYRKLGREDDAFLTDAQRHELGFLTEEAEILRHAERYVARGNPHRAARILEAAMNVGHVRRSQKNMNRLGDMWFEAREWKRARTFWTRHTGRPDGEHELKIARTYLEEQDWTSAERHLRRALGKGGLREPCKVRLLLAEVLREKQDGSAVVEYEKAAASDTCDENQRREAEEWAEYLRLEYQAHHHPYPVRQKQDQN